MIQEPGRQHEKCAGQLASSSSLEICVVKQKYTGQLVSCSSLEKLCRETGVGVNLNKMSTGPHIRRTSRARASAYRISPIAALL